MKKYRVLTVGFVVFALIFVQGTIGQTAMGPLRPEGVALSDANTPPPVKVMLGRNDVAPFRIAPPASFAAKPKTATFTINYLNAGETNYFDDVCVGWPEDAKAAFTYAANIWGTLLNSTVPIKISACWANMGTGGILGHGGARDYLKDFSSAPQASTYYPIAIANALYGSDLNDGTEEIVIAYNAQFTSWYYGTDGACPADKIDFVQVIMHEMCHGLGFIGSMSVSDGLGSWGLSDGSSYYPVIYDNYTENGAGTKLITYTRGSASLASQLTSTNVYFNGANANTGNGGSKVKLYAPSTWASGSSYAHLDEIFNGTTNAMMTYSVNYGEAIHNPGPVALGILKDNGWTGVTPPTPTQQGSPLLADYDGDGYADPTLFRTDGSFRFLLSRLGYYSYSTVYDSQCIAQQGDFDDDGVADPAVLDTSSGYWRFYSSLDNYSRYYIPVIWYVTGVTPVCGDYDGDHYADPMAYVNASGEWYILASRYDYGEYYYRQWGGSGYTPVCGDFDGDRYADPMLYDESTGYWYILRSRYQYSQASMWFGLSGYTPVTGDFDGDRYTDLAIYNTTSGMWYILLSSSGDQNYVGGVWDGSPR